jgi:hypothetical protein
VIRPFVVSNEDQPPFLDDLQNLLPVETIDFVLLQKHHHIFSTPPVTYLG